MATRRLRMSGPDTRPPEIDPDLLSSIEDHAVSLAASAGELLLDYFHRDMKVEYKSEGSRSPVSDADKGAEQLIVDGIRSRFPGHGILSEETPPAEDLDQTFVWVIDPLDGTTNFVNGFPVFSSSIGVLHHGKPVSGAIYVPSPTTSAGLVFHARCGGGAFAGDTPIRVYDKPMPMPNGLVMLPAAFWRRYRIGKELRRLGELRNIGSTAYEMTLVASGVMQYAAFSAPHPWDVVAGIAIVREAGGEVMARTSNRWLPLETLYGRREAGRTTEGDLAKWRASLLVGNSAIVTLLSENLKPAKRFWLWPK